MLTQGVDVVSFEPCDSEQGRLPASEDLDEQAVISKATMNRFASDNFRFVGKYDPSKFKPGPSLSAFENRTDEGPADIDTSNPMLTYIRVTREGHEYRARVARSNQNRYPAASFFPGTATIPPSRRDLGVIGVDTRSQVSNTLTYPISTIAHINFDTASSSYSCSGTLIAKSALLTAAHCVFDDIWKQWGKLQH